jgi:hypothetical protein
MTGGRPTVCKNHSIVEDATRAGEPDEQRRPPAAAPGRQPRRNWRIACGNCGNPSLASGGGRCSAPHLDWRIACGNCGNSFEGSRRRPTFRSPGFCRKSMNHIGSSRSAISRSLPRWILKPLGEGVLGKSSSAKTRSGTL